ncbi:MAG: response regulator transcription factor [Bacteroidota bacterium]
MDSSNYKILLVDDEPDIIEFLSYNLRKEGYKVISSSNGKDAIKIINEEKPHLVLLDVMMPVMDGIETCEEIRKDPEQKNVVIAFLTARGEDYSQIAGFEAGADDYITKPIKPKLLISRVKALLKRSGCNNIITDSEKIIFDDLIIDKERYIISKAGKEIILPKKEFELLILLTSRPDIVFTRDDIYKQVWGNDVIVGDRTIDVHIRKLREKLGENHIVTIKGVGYKFVK